MRTRKELRLTMMPGQAIDLVRTLVLGVLGPALLLGGCASFDRQPFEAAQIEAAHAPDSPKIRHWANSPDLLTQISIAPPPPGEPLRVLALSGGGDDGAYGAGFLNGWSQTGKRPEFAVVTGVSTGALIAPFALLGPDYDDELKRAYTEITPDDIYKDRFALAIPFSTSVATTEPLEALIARFATDAVIDAIGEEHRKGRRLFVGTVSLDRPGNAIWDMGAIAAGDAPGRYALFRRILLASSSVPVQFPPVLIEMEAQGERISELHVDGGTIATLMAAPPVANDQILRDSQSPTELYLLVNGKMAGEFELIEAGLSSIAKRTLEVMLFSSLQDCVASAYVWARSTGAGYHLTFIEQDFDADEHDLFEQDYMRTLFDYGVERGRAQAWQDSPPSSDPDTVASAVPETTSSED